MRREFIQTKVAEQYCFTVLFLVFNTFFKPNFIIFEGENPGPYFVSFMFSVVSFTNVISVKRSVTFSVGLTVRLHTASYSGLLR